MGWMGLEVPVVLCWYPPRAVDATSRHAVIKAAMSRAQQHPSISTQHDSIHVSRIGPRGPAWARMFMWFSVSLMDNEKTWAVPKAPCPSHHPMPPPCPIAIPLTSSPHSWTPAPCHGQAVAGPSHHMHQISLIATKPNSSRLHALVSGDSCTFSLAVF